MVFKNGVKNIEAATYNGLCAVHNIVGQVISTSNFFINKMSHANKLSVVSLQ